MEMDPFVVEVIHRFEARDGTQLTVEKGELLTVVEKDSSGWWIGRNATGKCGVFPSTYVQRVTTEPPPKVVVQEVIRARVLQDVGLQMVGLRATSAAEAAVLEGVEVDMDDMFALDDREAAEELRGTEETCAALAREGRELLEEVLRRLDTVEQEERLAQARQQLVITQKRLAGLSNDAAVAQDEVDALLEQLQDQGTPVPACLSAPGAGRAGASTPSVASRAGGSPAPQNLSFPGGGDGAAVDWDSEIPAEDTRVVALLGKVDGNTKAAQHLAGLERQLTAANDELDQMEARLQQAAGVIKAKETEYGELVEAAAADVGESGGSSKKKGATAVLHRAEAEAVEAEQAATDAKSKVVALQAQQKSLEGELAAAQAHYKEQCGLFDKEQAECESQASAFQSAKDRAVEALKQVEAIEAQRSDILAENARLLEEATSGHKAAIQEYKAIERERRVVYNELQELKGNLRVYCRVRPRGQGREAVVSVMDDMTLELSDPESDNLPQRFEFDFVFGETAQQTEVFQEVQPLATSILDGYNVCIFAYGQTGSGKTHTMEGPPHDRGLNFRTLRELFSLAEERKAEYRYEFRVAVLEVYNDKVFDLFSSRKAAAVRWGGKEAGVVVQPMKQTPVTSTEQVLQLLEEAYAYRKVAGTDCNTHSSRSHCCLTIFVEGTNVASGAKLNGKLHLIDLAGSERVKNSGVEGDRLKEAAHINKSLTHLKSVIQGLAGKKDHVPFRNAQLTALLQDSLGGNCKCLMFANVSPLGKDVPETVCTMKYASEARKVEVGRATAKITAA